MHTHSSWCPREVEEDIGLDKARQVTENFNQKNGMRCLWRKRDSEGSVGVREDGVEGERGWEGERVGR